MDTPTTPRHPSNGYEIIINATSLVGLSPAVASPLVKAGDLLSSQAQCTYSPYASPSIRRDGRRRSMRLEMRSPAKNLDLKLGSVDEEVETECMQTSAESDGLDDLQFDDVNKPVRRRQSLRLQAKQSTPAPRVVKMEQSSTKKSNKKRRQSAHYGVVGSVGLTTAGTEIAQVNETKPASKKKRRQSKCFGVAKSVNIEKVAKSEPKMMDVDPKSDAAELSPSICLTQEAKTELALALESIASSFMTTILEEHELEIAGEYKLNQSTDSLDDISFEFDEKENKPTISAIKRKKGRRDTFDLSKKRGLRVGPIMLDVPTPGSNTKTADVHKFEQAKPTGINIDTSIEEEANELKKNLFITPKNSDVNHDVTADLARTMKDDPHSQEVVVTNPEVKARMEGLEIVAVEKRMKTMFGQFKIYNYPCVSARIFSAMSLIFSTNSEEFNPLLPLLTCLVNAEIVSLQNRDENRDVYFINKRVCFSGYDYSSTMPAVDSIDGSHVDLVSSIEALQMVLQEARQLSPPAQALNSAIRCLDDMGFCDNVSNVCAKTLVGYFPSSRFRKAIKHYSNELKDIRCYLTGQESTKAEHIGVRFRLNDFIGRSIRFHFRKLLNSLPESLDFFVDECEERWGRAVDDRSISSILNFSLEKVNQFMLSSPQLFDDHEVLPTFFSKDASEIALACGKMQDVRVRASLKSIGDDALKDIASDLQEARRFLLGARACKFVWELLDWPGVKEHIKSKGGWKSIESISQVFYDLHLYANSDHQHFVLLRNVDDLAQMLAKAVERFENTTDSCESAIRKLRRQMISRQKDHAYKTKGTAMYALRMSLEAEKGEKFPVPMANYSC